MKPYTNCFISAMLVAMFQALPATAQTEIVLNPAELIPHEDGYYIAGVNLDLDEGFSASGFRNPPKPLNLLHGINALNQTISNGDPC